MQRRIIWSVVLCVPLSLACNTAKRDVGYVQSQIGNTETPIYPVAAAQSPVVNQAVPVQGIAVGPAVSPQPVGIVSAPGAVPLAMAPGQPLVEGPYMTMPPPLPTPRVAVAVPQVQVAPPAVVGVAPMVAAPPVAVAPMVVQPSVVAPALAPAVVFATPSTGSSFAPAGGAAVVAVPAAPPQTPGVAPAAPRAGAVPGFRLNPVPIAGAGQSGITPVGFLSEMSPAGLRLHPRAASDTSSATPRAQPTVPPAPPPRRELQPLDEPPRERRRSTEELVPPTPVIPEPPPPRATEEESPELEPPQSRPTRPAPNLMDEILPPPVSVPDP